MRGPHRRRRRHVEWPGTVCREAVAPNSDDLEPTTILLRPLSSRALRVLERDQVITIFQKLEEALKLRLHVVLDAQAEVSEPPSSVADRAICSHLPQAHRG